MRKLSAMCRCQPIVRLLALAAAMSGSCAGAAADDAEFARLRPLLGDYVGQWNTEASPDPYDDISRYELESSVMRLGFDGRPTLDFYLDQVAASGDEPLDLLGFGCGSRVGEAVSVSLGDPPAAEEELTTVLDASFDFHWGDCPARVYPFPSNRLHLEVAVNPADREYVARVSLLRKLQPDNKAYITRDGQDYRVVIRPKPGGTHYHPAHQYCVIDEYGETQECFERRSKVKHLVIPFPLPGASAVWWTSRDKVRIVEGQRALYHEAVYRRSMPDGAQAE